MDAFTLAEMVFSRSNRKQQNKEETNNVEICHILFINALTACIAGHPSSFIPLVYTTIDTN